MSSVDKIKWAMSLRDPQYEALQYFDAISSKIEYRTCSKADAEKIASENCQNPHTISVDKEFDFPSFCFDMTTGIGKSRLMGACIYYLYKTKGYKHFFILAPGNTIYDKMRREAVPGHPKYMFKGLEAEMGRPKVYDGENYLSYPVRYIQEEMVVEKTSDIQIFIFNISKIFTRGDIEFKFHKFNENLGGSFADVLRSFDAIKLLTDWNTIEAKEYAKIAIGRVKTIEQFEKFIQTNASERDVIQKFLEEFPWLLDAKMSKFEREITYTKLLKQKFNDESILPESNRRLDFLCTNSAGVIHVIELKRPRIKLTMKEIQQICEYVEFIETQFPQTQGNVKGFLISDNMTYEPGANKYRKGLEKEGIFIKSYSDLLAEARRYNDDLYKMYEDISMKKNNKSDK